MTKLHTGLFVAIIAASIGAIHQIEKIQSRDNAQTLADPIVDRDKLVSQPEQVDPFEEVQNEKEDSSEAVKPYDDDVNEVSAGSREASKALDAGLPETSSGVQEKRDETKQDDQPRFILFSMVNCPACPKQEQFAAKLRKAGWTCPTIKYDPRGMYRYDKDIIDEYGVKEYPTIIYFEGRKEISRSNSFDAYRDVIYWQDEPAETKEFVTSTNTVASLKAILRKWNGKPYSAVMAKQWDNRAGHIAHLRQGASEHAPFPEHLLKQLTTSELKRLHDLAHRGIVSGRDYK